MFKNISLDKVNTEAKRIVISEEFIHDAITPCHLIDAFEDHMQDGVILESLNDESCNYTYIAFDSFARFRVENGGIFQTIHDETRALKGDVFHALRALFKELACSVTCDSVSGGVGFMTYDAVRLFEEIKDPEKTQKVFPDIQFHFYRTTIFMDHASRKITLSMVMDISADMETLARKKMDALIHQMVHVTLKKNEENISPISTVHVDMDDDTYMELVLKAKENIMAGDVFQMVLSRTYQMSYTKDPLQLYRVLRRLNPSPYMFYLPFKDCVMVGASPEKLVRVEDRSASVNTIAGTQKRGNDMQELLNNVKERAEHMMLVDLARNDLGKVCVPGSIKINALLKVRDFSHVSHITSQISGTLMESKDALDALRAVFPAGTLTGAPKIRAMELIDEYEMTRRGIYGGAIFRMDFNGNLDSAIAIRMAVLKDGFAMVRTGAGIVYDSDPLSESLETRYKAQGILNAIS